jgi:hypothetical protein
VANQVKRLYIDTSSNKLVKSAISTAPITDFFFVQGDTVTLIIQLLEPNPSGGIVAPYSTVILTGLSFRVGIGTASSVIGSGIPGIFQSSFSIDSSLNTATGILYIEPTAAATLITPTLKANAADFEIEVSEGGNYSTVYSGSIQLRAELIEAASPPVPSPGDTYLTANEINANYLSKAGIAGESKLWISANGSFKVLQYLGDDGVMHFDPVT